MIKTDSLVTLHYRIRLGDGRVAISTFDSTPATMKLGCGELMPTLEAYLVGLDVGAQEKFDLAEGAAFGERNEKLVHRFARQDLPDDLELDDSAVIEFSTPTGEKFAGLVREYDDQSALIDFNHPLAGKAVSFEVQIVAVL